MNSIFSPNINSTIGSWAKKDCGSNYVLVKWIEKVIMGGLLCV